MEDTLLPAPGEFSALDFILSHAESIQNTHVPSTPQQWPRPTQCRGALGGEGMGDLRHGVHSVAAPNTRPWSDFQLSPAPAAHSLLGAAHWVGMTPSISERF